MTATTTNEAAITTTTAKRHENKKKKVASLSARLDISTRNGKMARLVKSHFATGHRVSKGAIIYLCKLADELDGKIIDAIEEERGEDLQRRIAARKQRTLGSVGKKVKDAERALKQAEKNKADQLEIDSAESAVRTAKQHEQSVAKLVQSKDWSDPANFASKKQIAVPEMLSALHKLGVISLMRSSNLAYPERNTAGAAKHKKQPVKKITKAAAVAAEATQKSA
jgi:hypothetical protein